MSVYEPSEYSQECAQEIPMISHHATPRTLELLLVMPPRFISPLFHALYTLPAKREPQPTKPQYWDTIYRFIHAIPKNLIMSDAQIEIWAKEIPPHLNQAAQLELRGREAGFILLAFLNPTRDHLRVADSAKDHIHKMLRLIYAVVDKEPEIAQRILNVVLFSLVRYELDDILHLIIEKLCVPSYVTHFGMGFSLLYIASYADDARRQYVYEHFLPARIRPLSYAAFKLRTQFVRDSPLLLCLVLKQLPPRFPHLDFEREFIKAIYPMGDEPEDVGRQALAFMCKAGPEVWRQFAWPHTRAVQKRLTTLGKSRWCIRRDEIKQVLYF